MARPSVTGFLFGAAVETLGALLFLAVLASLGGRNLLPAAAPETSRPPVARLGQPYALLPAAPAPPATAWSPAESEARQAFVAATLDRIGQKLAEQLAHTLAAEPVAP